MNLDLATVPFSHYGSCLAFNILEDGQLWLRSMRGVIFSHEAFRVSLLAHDGSEALYRCGATPTRLKLQADQGAVEFCFADPDLVVLRGEGLSLQLTAPTVPQELVWKTPFAYRLDGNDRWQINHTRCRTQFIATATQGSLEVQDQRSVDLEGNVVKTYQSAEPRVTLLFRPGQNGRFQGCLQEFTASPKQLDTIPDYPPALASAQQAWDNWLADAPQLRSAYQSASPMAQYVNWSAVVRPTELVRRPTMLMSKNIMTQCWAWDHCFNAIALARHRPELAWDQLVTLFDHQDPSGALPDCVSVPHTLWNYCKPPIHGWTFARLEELGCVSSEQRQAFYPQLAAWTDWWMTHRAGQDGLPEYRHGNDSGWDNGTAFDAGFPVAGPDLAAFLIVQMDTLASMAGDIDRPTEAASWTQRADELFALLMQNLWDGQRFRPRRPALPVGTPEGDTLMNFLPLLLGQRLSPKIRDTLAAGLRSEERFLSHYGPATESLSSPHYKADSYWRGPIWGSSTYLLIDGLRRSGFPDQAQDLADRYCRLCAENGFAENFNSLTGEPLRDRAYTWTSSAFIALAAE